MSANQISTSVSIIDALNGFMNLSLTEYNTSAAAAIAAGSVVNVAGGFFRFPADETPTGWSSITTGTTAYIALTASGTAGSQVVNAGYVSDAPTWRDDLGAWYASAASEVRIVASVYKAESTSYWPKVVLSPLLNNGWANALNSNIGTGWPTAFSSNIGTGWGSGMTANLATGWQTAFSSVFDYSSGDAVLERDIKSSTYGGGTWSTTSTSYVSMTERIYAHRNGTVKTSFGLRAVVGGTASGRIYKNGVAVGTERSTGSLSIVTYTEDIAVSRGDYLEVYSKTTGGGASSIIGDFFISVGSYN